MLAAHQKSESTPSATFAAIVSLLNGNADSERPNFDDEPTARQLLAQLRWHRVGVRLQQEIPTTLAAHQRKIYDGDCQSALKTTAANIKTLVRVASCLDARGIPYLCLKGPALAQLLYGSALLKQSADIDILVRPQDALAAIDALNTIDITPAAPVPANPRTWQTIQLLGKDWGLDDRITGCRVEMHWRVEINPFLLSTQFDHWFARKSCEKIGNVAVNTLCLEDTFIQIMVHGARSLWARLHWLLDFDALLRRDDIDWKQVTEAIDGQDLQQILLYSYQLSRHLLRSPPPTALAMMLNSASRHQQQRAQKLIERSLQAMRQRRNVTWLPLRLCHLQLKQGKSFQAFEVATLLGPGYPDVIKLPLPIYFLPAYLFLRPWFVLQRRLLQISQERRKTRLRPPAKGKQTHPPL